MKTAAGSLWAAAVFLLCGAGASASKVAEDAGPAAIDVSSYPPQYQKTYHEVFVPLFTIIGGTARAVNSPIIELDPRLEERERAANPGLFADPAAARVSRDGWKREVNNIRTRPPCCGACPVLSLAQARELWRFLVYDSIVRKTGPNAGPWLAHRRTLLNRAQGEKP